VGAGGGPVPGTLQKETKKGRNGQLSPHGAFNLGPGLILWLN
jgi:hypothetical protein